MRAASNSWLLYWRDFFFDRAQYGLKIYAIIYHTRNQWFYESANVGDDVWLVVRREDGRPKSWQLAMRLSVWQKRTDHRNYRPYRLVPEPEGSQVFSLNDHPDLEPLLCRLRFASGKKLRVSGGKIGRALQSPRLLTELDALLMEKWALKLHSLW